MAADILVFKKKGNHFSAMITKGMAHGRTPQSYFIKVNLSNPRDLALFLQDLKFLHDAPMDRAIEFYKEGRENPFF